jgi:LacI family transcriptional regulator
MKKASLKTIAEDVGVTVSTVSRILRNDPTCYIKAERREAILAAAKRHNYSPNIIARNLALGKTFNVAFVVRRFEHFQRWGPLLWMAIDGLQDGLRSAGYSCSLVTISSEDDLRKLAGSSSLYDGLVIGRGVVSAEGLRLLEEAGMPFAFLNDNAPHLSEHPRTFIDKQSGARELVSYLLGLGHKKIAIFGSGWNADMLAGAFEQAGMSIGAGSRFPLDAENIHTLALRAFAESDALVGSLSSHSAVCCANDYIALGLCERLKRLNIAVGSDIAVTGYDNLETLTCADESERIITTVDNPQARVGLECAGLLLRLIGAGKETPEDGLVTVPARLIIRRSTSGAVQT